MPRSNRGSVRFVSGSYYHDVHEVFVPTTRSEEERFMNMVNQAEARVQRSLKLGELNRIAKFIENGG